MIYLILGPIGLIEFILRLVVVVLLTVTVIGLMLVLENGSLDSILVPFCWRLIEQESVNRTKR